MWNLIFGFAQLGAASVLLFNVFWAPKTLLLILGSILIMSATIQIIEHYVKD